MAGVTNYPFRRLCKGFGAGLFVSEMISARGIIEQNAKTLKLADFGPEDQPRSMQLYGVEPVSLGEAARRVHGLLKPGGAYGRHAFATALVGEGSLDPSRGASTIRRNSASDMARGI